MKDLKRQHTKLLPLKTCLCPKFAMKYRSNEIKILVLNLGD